MSLSTICQLYRDGQFYWWRKLVVINRLGIMMFLQVYFAVSVEDDIDVPGYFKWIHVSVARVDLLCPDCCSPESTNPCLPIFSYFSTDKSTICCVANAVPFWKFNQYSHLRAYWDLGIDYEQTTGRPLKFGRPESADDSTVCILL
jgi:hypothetical protein